MTKSLLPRFTLGTTIVLVMGLVKVLSPHFEDPDFYWHIKTGEHLLSTWPLGRADVFSYPNAGHAWVLSEWGSQVILYLIFHAFSYMGIAWFVALLCVGCLGMVYRCCTLLGSNEVRSSMMSLLCGVFLLYVTPRPHLFTFLLFSIVLTILLGFKYHDRTGRLWLLPIIMVLWANLHGGYFVGLGLMAVFTASEWLRYMLSGPDILRKSKLTRLTLVVFVSLLATLINPEFIRYWWYPIEAIILSGDTWMINEWHSPSFHESYAQYFLVLLVCFIAVLVYSRQKPDVTEFAVPGLFIAAALLSVRNLPLAVITIVPFFSRFSTSLAVSLQDGRSQSGGERGPFALAIRRLVRIVKEDQPSIDGGAPVMNAILLATVGLTVFLLYPAQQKKIDASVEKYLPVKATDFLLREHVQGKMFNAYQYGGYLIFRLYPVQKVFIYGRTDILPPGALPEFDNIYSGRANWRKYFDHYGIDYVICAHDDAIRQILQESGAFRLVYDDEHHSVLVKNDSRFYALISKYGK